MEEQKAEKPVRLTPWGVHYVLSEDYLQDPDAMELIRKTARVFSDRQGRSAAELRTAPRTSTAERT